MWLFAAYDSHVNEQSETTGFATIEAEHRGHQTATNVTKAVSDVEHIQDTKDNLSGTSPTTPLRHRSPPFAGPKVVSHISKFWTYSEYPFKRLESCHTALAPESVDSDISSETDDIDDALVNAVDALDTP